MFYRKALKYLLIILITQVAINCSSENRAGFKGKAIKGTLDLSEVDFSETGQISLGGEWEIYWDELLSPKDIELSSDLIPDYIQVPVTWKDQVVNNKKLPLFGKATYKLTVLLPDNGSILALRFKINENQYEIYINGESVYSNTESDIHYDTDEIPAIKHFIEYIYGSEKIEIIIQAKNEDLSDRSGLTKEIYIGNPDDVNNDVISDIIINIFTFGTIFIIGLYHIVLFLSRRRELIYIFFSFSCMIMSFYTVFVYQIVLYYLFPAMNMGIQFKIEFIFELSFSPIFLAMFYYLFPRTIPSIILKISSSIVFIFALFVVFSPLSVVHTVYHYSFIIIIAHLLLGIYALILEAVRKNYDVYWILFGTLSFGFTGINDMLISFGNPLINTYLTPYGIIMFIFSHAIVLSIKFSRTFDKVEKLSIENTNLLKEVNLLNNKIHNSIKNKLDSIKGRITNFIIPYSGSIDNDILQNIKIISNLTSHCTNECKNILFVINHQKCTIQDLTEELEIRAKLQLSLLNIDFRIEKKIENKGLIIPTDKLQHFLDIYNEVLNNVVKHSQADFVSISLFYNNQFLKIIVSDNGKGFDYRTSENKRGHYGLTIMKQSASINNSTFEIDSIPDKGTKVLLIINI